MPRWSELADLSPARRKARTVGAIKQRSDPVGINRERWCPAIGERDRERAAVDALDGVEVRQDLPELAFADNPTFAADPVGADKGNTFVPKSGKNPVVHIRTIGQATCRASSAALVWQS